MRKIRKHINCLGILLATLIAVSSMDVKAYAPYDTYTYSTDIMGRSAQSPDAYVPDRAIDSVSCGLELGLNQPMDIAVDSEGYVYIADTGNNRIVVLNSDYSFYREIKGYIADGGATSTFNQPEGIFVNNEGTLYIADTLNNRIVLMSRNGGFRGVINAPEEDLLQNVIFEPTAIAVDEFDRIYVISKSSNMGVLAFASDGSFQGFIGAEKTQGTFLDIVKNFFRSSEQKKRRSQNVPTEYNNITVDEKGFLYVTTSALQEYEQEKSMITKTGTANPIKRLNPSGTDVLKRNGAFNQGGDLQYRGDNCSRFIDVALADAGVYSCLDSTDGKIFTYDAEGKLMYVFGGLGVSLGVYQRPVAITYNGTDLLVLDATAANITILKRTEYADVFFKALDLQLNRKYTEAAEVWKELLKYNNAYEEAYNGIATSYMRIGQYKEAMEYYKYGGDLSGYQKAYTAYRKEVLEKYVLLIPIAIVLIIFLLYKLNKKIKEENNKAWSKVAPFTLLEELRYGFYVIFHPFDGFYELKRQKRGTMKGAICIFTVSVFEQLFRMIGTGYIATGTSWARVSIVDAFMSTGALIILWSVANWAFTTLMDGKGKMSEIFIGSCYALIPTIIIGLPCTLFTNVSTVSELKFVGFFYSLANIWTLALIFFGALVINDYSLLKNILTTILSIVGMVFIAFVGVLGINLFTSMIGFIQTIVNEIIYRM